MEIQPYFFIYRQGRPSQHRHVYRRAIQEQKIAINFVNELREKTKALEAFPECGAITDDRIMKNSDYRFLVHKEYLIFYHYIAKDNTSYILSIFNAKRDYSGVMRKFIKK